MSAKAAILTILALALTLVQPPPVQAEVGVATDILLTEDTTGDMGGPWRIYSMSWCNDRPDRGDCRARKVTVPTWDDFVREKDRVDSLVSGAVSPIRKEFSEYKTSVNDALMKKLDDMPAQVAKKETVMAMKKELERRIDCEMKNVKEALAFEMRMELAMSSGRNSRNSPSNPPVPKNCDN